MDKINVYIAYPYMVKMIVLSLGTLFKATEWGQWVHRCSQWSNEKPKQKIIIGIDWK